MSPDSTASRHARQNGRERDWLTPSGPGPRTRRSRPSDSGERSRPGPADGKGDEPRDAGGGGKRDGDRKKDEDRKTSGKPQPWWPYALAVLVVLAFIAVVLWLIFKPNADIWTDDAYVRVHYTSVAPRISGKVIAVPVDDDDEVRAGDLLMALDPRDYETAVASAEAMVARDRAGVSDASANLTRQPDVIGEREAAVRSARARLEYSQADARRFTNLASTGAGTNQQHQLADATLQQDQAQVDSAEALLAAAKRQLDVLKAQRLSSEAAVRADEAQLEQARLNLSYTKVVAPLDGMVGQRSVQVGNYLSPGATVMVLVPLNDVYVTANYLETDLDHVRGGQRATIHVDAYNIDLDGVVNGVPPASGASFAPIAPNNATGNFTKIVQRLPVRIDVVPGQPLAKLLRVGFSVETTIHTGLEDVVAEQRGSARRITAH